MILRISTSENPALQENLAFEMAYLQKLYGDQAAPIARDLAQAMAMYPGMKGAMARIQTEGRNLDGTPILTTVTEVLSIDSTVAAGDVEIPTGFRQK